jgi:hypothetical protein
MPSPGQTTLTRLPGGDFDVDSFFDVYYQAEFEGCPGSQLQDLAGTTTGATIKRTCWETSGVPDKPLPGDPPAGFSVALSRVEPNPFTGSTEVIYSIPEGGPVRLEVFNVMGQVVRTLVDENRPAGTHTTMWSGTDDYGTRLPAGIYFCRLSAGRQNITRKVLYLR